MQLKDENPFSICNTPPRGKVRKLKRKSAKSSSTIANRNFFVDFLTSNCISICFPRSDGMIFPFGVILGLNIGLQRIGFFFKIKSVRGVFESKDNLRRSTIYTKHRYSSEKNLDGNNIEI
jgi:hypothetical protein